LEQTVHFAYVTVLWAEGKRAYTKKKKEAKVPVYAMIAYRGTKV
jgi:hypothetical protein